MVYRMIDLQFEHYMSGFETFIIYFFLSKVDYFVYFRDLEEALEMGMDWSLREG